MPPKEIYDDCMQTLVSISSLAGMAAGRHRVAVFSLLRYDPNLNFSKEFWHQIQRTKLYSAEVRLPNSMASLQAVCFRNSLRTESEIDLFRCTKEGGKRCPKSCGTHQLRRGLSCILAQVQTLCPLSKSPPVDLRKGVMQDAPSVDSCNERQYILGLAGARAAASAAKLSSVGARDESSARDRALRILFLLHEWLRY